MNDKQFVPSLTLLPTSISLVRQHITAVVWLVYLPALLMGLGQMFVGQVYVSHHYASSVTFAQIGSDVMHSGKGQLGLCLMAAGLLWSLLAFPAIIVGTLKAAKGKEFDPVHTVKASGRYFWRILGTVLLIAIVVEIGLILLIVPGIILLRMFLLAPYYLVDKDLRVFEALKLSAKRSRLSPAPIYGVIGVLIWLIIGGALLGVIPVIGVVVSLIVTYLYMFGPALRFIELNRLYQSGDKKAVARHHKT